MSPGLTGPLGTDFDVMTSVAGRIDVLNDDVRAMLQTFIGKMSSVPPSVWGGAAAVRFRDVVDRWNGECGKESRSRRTRRRQSSAIGYRSH